MIDDGDYSYSKVDGSAWYSHGWEPSSWSTLSFEGTTSTAGLEGSFTLKPDATMVTITSAPLPIIFVDSLMHKVMCDLFVLPLADSSVTPLLAKDTSATVILGSGVAPHLSHSSLSLSGLHLLQSIMSDCEFVECSKYVFAWVEVAPDFCRRLVEVQKAYDLQTYKLSVLKWYEHIVNRVFPMAGRTFFFLAPPPVDMAKTDPELFEEVLACASSVTPSVIARVTNEITEILTTSAFQL